MAEFPDGSVFEYAANVIAKAIYNQAHDDVRDNTLFEAFIGHKYQPQIIRGILFLVPKKTTPL